MLENIIYVANIVDNTIVDGEGFRTSLYVSGCDIHCEDCHNKDWWDMKKGTPMTIEEAYEKINYDFTNITFIGGEPMMQAKSLTKLAKKIKKDTNKTIWLYSGHTYEEIVECADFYGLLRQCDVLVDGKFEKQYFKNNLKFRGSTNQRIIDIKKTLAKNEIVLWYDEFCIN
ncbi:anaerobic ribonucleoside-triphosphate reductase activating protein [Sedimentibacter sp. zth1]|uniref:anaerobic ribonucleoside-triphosphate reductase activating protein n=1 Tax=Sedimentibacter sp. zth1 TaxID=2816908 RepID=UPI001A938B1C|nr:anaerobic ribonucleoside-triphosphate reductase activating protein [Sedimentibacter sp. zth1]QSX05104.1 anaerobic ribonucleoside-triphosphate reductase activating protein [Sedimentibacter sp. zth1]